MASSSSSAQERSISCPKQYDAFISHRGPDVKHTLAKQLYDLLKARECRAFLDREEIEGGDIILAAIRNGIRSSAVQIAIFSKGYAESSWCLDELVLMLEQTGALFIPVFYDVKPGELRRFEYGKSQYAAAFSNYQSKGRNLDRLDAWKEALAFAADISGYEHQQDRRDLCEKIVSRVVQEMQKRTPLIVAKYPIALDEIVQDFERSCPQTAGLVGIFGLGGSGKTTLAKELFNRKPVTAEYGSSCFLSDVRESHAKSKLDTLQRQLLRDIFNDNRGLRNVDEGMARLKHCLEGARDWNLLIILDDVDDQDQLDFLLPGIEGMLSSGSLVIITTRDQSVLTAADVSIRYKMKALDRDHAKQLFCSHALRPQDSHTIYEKLVESFLEFCGDLPLSLIVLGAHVRGFWKLELGKVKNIPRQEILQRLKISFDSLDKEEKQIFIDIACFFNKYDFDYKRQRPEYSLDGVSMSLDDITPEIPKFCINELQKGFACGETEPISIWKTFGWSAKHAVEILQQKCLLELVQDYDYWHFEMHDQLRDLGRRMADELVPPRLWRPDILRSMKAKGFKHILDETKARCFNLVWDSSLEIMIRYFTGSLNESAEIVLLWLDITGDEGSLKRIPPWIPLRKVHCLCVENMELWNSFQQHMQTNSQASFELRRLHIREDCSLQKLPELGQLQRLNTLELYSCYELETISGLSSLKGLQSLHVTCCDKLKTISDLSSLTALQSLHVQMCTELKTIAGLSSLTGLQSLNVNRCRRLETVFSLSSLRELRSLHMQGYVDAYFRSEIMLSEELNVANIRNLERIAIVGCGQLQRVTGFEELQGLKSVAIEVGEDGYGWVRNCVYALRRLPSENTILKGYAVDKAMSRLNEDLFSEVIGGATIHEIDRGVDKVHMSSSSSAITIYALLSECGKIDTRTQTRYAYSFKSAGGHVMLTVILPPRSQCEFRVRRHGVGKGYKATVNEGEEGKALSLLQHLVDRLYGASTLPKLAAYDAVKRKRKRN